MWLFNIKLTASNETIGKYPYVSKSSLTLNQTAANCKFGQLVGLLSKYSVQFDPFIVFNWLLVPNLMIDY